MADASFSWRSALAGFGFSIVGGLATAYVQYQYTRQQQQAQLFLDEKKEFVGACDNYLRLYGRWFELARHYALKDSVPNMKWESIDSISVDKAYIRFRHNFDYGYGKMFLVSDNDFGFITMQVSTVLSSSLNILMFDADTLSNRTRYRVFTYANEYFQEHWLLRAQREIFRYNTGNRLQKTLRQSVTEFSDSVASLKQDSVVVENMYKSLEQVDAYMQRRDSLQGKKSKSPRRSRMPTRKEFREFVRPGQPQPE